MPHHEKMAQDIYEILSDDEVLKFIPEKRLKSIEDARNFLTGTVFAYQYERNFTHFIKIKEINKTIGVINVITPKTVEQDYKFVSKYTWMIEYYIHQAVWGRNIMSDVFPYFVKRMLSQGVEKIGAACFPDNIASIKLLEKAEFVKKHKFDNVQDYYELVKYDV